MIQYVLLWEISQILEELFSEQVEAARLMRKISELEAEATHLSFQDEFLYVA
mgnify:CR=1 FL=1